MTPPTSPRIDKCLKNTIVSSAKSSFFLNRPKMLVVSCFGSSAAAEPVAGSASRGISVISASSAIVTSFHTSVLPQGFTHTLDEVGCYDPLPDAEHIRVVRIDADFDPMMVGGAESLQPGEVFDRRTDRRTLSSRGERLVGSEDSDCRHGQPSLM